MKNTAFFNMYSAIAAFFLFMIMSILINNSPYGLAKLKQITDGHSILDMELKGYSVEKAYEILDNLGEEGRAFHLRTIAPLDFPFPLAYGMFYFITLTLIAKSLLKKMPKPWLLGCTGLLAALFDWLENIMIISLLKHYPDKLINVAKTASVFTQLKSFFILTSMGLILLGLVMLLLKKLLLKFSCHTFNL